MQNLRPSAGERVTFLREAGRPLMFIGIAIGVLACLLALAIRIALGDNLDWQQLGALVGAIALALKHQDDRSAEVRHEMTLRQEAHVALEPIILANPPRGGVVPSAG